jgi:WD40 repeat protein
MKKLDSSQDPAKRFAWVALLCFAWSAFVALLWLVGDDLHFEIGIVPHERFGAWWFGLTSIGLVFGFYGFVAGVACVGLAACIWSARKLRLGVKVGWLRDALSGRFAESWVATHYRLLIVVAVLLLGVGIYRTLQPVLIGTKKGLVATLHGHVDGVPCVSFSPDGATLASGGLAATIRLWDVAQGTELRVLQGHSFRIGEVTFSPDGKLLASGDGYVWSPTSPLHPSTSGKTAHEPMQRQAQIETSTPFTVILWDAASGTERRRWEVETPIHTVAFSPRGDRLAAGGGWPDGRAEYAVFVWDTVTGRSIAAWRLDVVWSVAFAPDGTTLATGQTNGIVLSDAETGALKTGWSTSSPIRSLAFAPDGGLLAAGDADGVVHLWDLQRDQESVTLREHRGVVDSLAFTADGSLLASAGQDGTVRLWDVARGEVVATIRIPRRWVSVALAPDDELLATGSSDGLVRLWDVTELLR